MKERVFIVGLKTEDNFHSYEESMDELGALAESAGAELVSRIDQAGNINPRTYIGSGKVLEIKELAENMEIDSIIFNSELSGSQIRNLEKIIDRKIIDRTSLILDIFATRAKTNEAVLQVALAQAEYMLPRLQGYSGHLSRTGGGIGTRGPGEQQLETDRRHIRSQISRIKEKLKIQEKNRQVVSKKRNSSRTPVVSLLGYTNVGKSTIMNKIMDYGKRDEDTRVYADDRLFATLQTSHRRVEHENTKFILADTVGLIEDLPINLVEAFKSTLEEVSYSDLILIVIDASNTNIKRQLASIQDLIERLEIGNIPIINVFNKIDMKDEYMDIPTSWFEGRSIEISALNEKDIDYLLKTIVQELTKTKTKARFLIPYEDSKTYSWVMEKFRPSLNEASDKGMVVEMVLEKDEYEKLKKYEVGDGL